MELYNNKELLQEYKNYARRLVAQMSLEEKISQTMNASPAIERLGIPTYNWWNEALHGVARAGTATVFPQAIGLAATFDEEFVERIAEAISDEGRGKYNMQQKYLDSDIYKGLTFWAPNINIFRDPRWGRGHETFEEDPYLTALNNGCDLNCGRMYEYLKEASEKGLLDEERLDEAVVNLLTARLKLGTIKLPQEGKNDYDRIPYEVVDCKKHQELNKEAAIRSLVLLKNENRILPLDKKKLKTVGVIGPNADNRRALTGNYEGTASHYWTILEGIQEYLGEDVRVLYSQGCHLWDKHTVGLSEDHNLRAEVRGVCDASDVIIACVGLDATFEGEEGDAWSDSASMDGDKPNLYLPGLQQDVLEEIYESGKPVILLVLSGSALALDWADTHFPAIMQCWYPGAQGGRGIAEVLFGDRNPEGKLPITFYKESYKLPEFTDYSMTQLKAVQKVTLNSGEEKQIQIPLPKEAFGLYDENGKWTFRKTVAKVYVGGHAPDRRSECLTGEPVCFNLIEVC